MKRGDFRTIKIVRVILCNATVKLRVLLPWQMVELYEIIVKAVVFLVLFFLPNWRVENFIKFSFRFFLFWAVVSYWTLLNQWISRSFLYLKRIYDIGHSVKFSWYWRCRFFPNICHGLCHIMRSNYFSNFPSVIALVILLYFYWGQSILVINIGVSEFLDKESFQRVTDLNDLVPACQLQQWKEYLKLSLSWLGTIQHL